MLELQMSTWVDEQLKNLPGHGDDGRNCVVHGRLLSSLLVEHSQNSIYGYSKSLSSNVYGSPNWETYKAHESKSI